MTYDAFRTISRYDSGPGQVGLAQRNPTWSIAGSAGWTSGYAFG